MWDFETDPQYQSKLDWVEKFMAEELEPLDLVLADPPYNVDSADVDAILAALGTNGWTREGTVAVVERATTCAPLTWPEGWRRWPQRVYGDTRLELAERLFANV
ncbi:hypothetical protein GR255_04350 [Mycobacterium tuberculosis]|nr:hypothetical protein [Mycobacterium tuberculosis]